MNAFGAGPFRWLWASTFCAALAAGIGTTAISWSALQAGGAFGVGVSLAAWTLPSLLFGLAAGTLADGPDRRRQIVAVSAVSIPIGLAAAVLLAQGATLPVVALVAFALGCLGVFGGPARQALVPDTVPPEAALGAFAMYSLGMRLGLSAGALVAGPTITAFGPASCFPLMAGMYLLAALLAMGIRVHETARMRIPRPGFRTALAEAGRLILSVPALRILSIAGVTCEIFAFSVHSAVPVIAQDTLHLDATGLGALSSAELFGGVLAVVTLGFRSRGAPKEWMLGGAFIVFGIAIAALGRAQDPLTAGMILLLVGACGSLFDVLQQALIQRTVPDAQRGRAAGIWYVGTGSAPIGHLEMGFVATALGAPGALLLNGTIVAACALILAILAPAFRMVRRPA